jgi:hypothetical protein
MHEIFADDSEENTEGAITNEQSKEIGNIGNKTKKNKTKTQIT